MTDTNMPPSAATPSRSLPGSLVICAIALAVLGLSTASLTGLRQDSGPLAALPQAPQVDAFRAFDANFGVLRVVQVAVETDNVFSLAFLQHLREASDALKDVPGVAHVLSLTTVADIAPDPSGGVTTGKLIEDVPVDPEGLARLRQKVLSRPAVVNNLLSGDTQAVQMVVSLSPKANPDAVMAALLPILTQHFDNRFGVGGVAAVSTSVAQAAAPLQRWGMVAAGVWLLLMGLAAAAGRGWWQAWRPLAALLLSTWLAPAVALGAFAAFKGLFTPLLALAPLVGALLTSALALHALSILRELPTPWTWRRVMRGLAPTWAAGACATAVLAIPALWAPRLSSLLAAAAALVGTLCATCLVPALCAPAREPAGPGLSAPRAPRWLAAVCCVAALGLGTQLPRLQFSNDLSTLLGPQALPVRAERIVAEHFQTGAMVQVEVHAPLREPAMLRRVQTLVDQLVITGGVKGVSYVGDALRQANAAMDGSPGLPDSRAKAELLVSFMGSDPAAKRLLSSDGEHAVLYVNLARPADAGAVEWLVRTFDGAYTAAPLPEERSERQMTMRLRLQAAAVQTGVTAPTAKVAFLVHQAENAVPPVDPAPVVAGIQHFLASEESVWSLPATDARNAVVAQAVAALGPNAKPSAIEAAVMQALHHREDAELVGDWAAGMEGPLHTLWRNAQAGQQATALLTAAKLPTEPEPWHAAVADALLAYAEPVAVARAGGPWALQSTVHGQPVLDRVLVTQSSQQWWRSLAAATGACLLLSVGLSRALRRGAVVASPVMVSTLLLYGSLATLHIPLDVSTAGLLSAMLALALVHTLHVCAHPRRDTRAVQQHAFAWAVPFALVAAVTAPPIARLATGVAIALALIAAVTWLLITAWTVREGAPRTLPQAVGGQP